MLVTYRCWLSAIAYWRPEWLSGHWNCTCNFYVFIVFSLENPENPTFYVFFELLLTFSRTLTSASCRYLGKQTTHNPTGRPRCRRARVTRLILSTVPQLFIYMYTVRWQRARSVRHRTAWLACPHHQPTPEWRNRDVTPDADPGMPRSFSPLPVSVRQTPTGGFDLQHRGFLLVHCFFSATGMKQTDRRTDARTGRSIAYPPWRRA